MHTRRSLSSDFVLAIDCALAVAALGARASAQHEAWRALGSANGSDFGVRVAALGDANGDGRADVAVSAQNAQSGAGQVSIFFGRPAASFVPALPSLQAPTPYCGATFASADLVLQGAQPCDRFGVCVAGIGDLDGDGSPDVAIGADEPPHTGPGCGIAPFSGYVEVRAASSGALICRILGSAIGAADGDELGQVLCAAGDVDQDGFVDLALGARQGGASGTRTYEGYVKVVSGQSLVGACAPQVLFTVAGANANDALPTLGLASLPDANQDGLPELAIGWPGADPSGSADAGRVDLYSGAAAWLSFAGTHAADNFGTHLGRVGDIDANGSAELIVGAPHYAGGAPGSARVIDPLLANPLLEATGLAAGDCFGTSVGNWGAVSDVDGDGVSDFAIGAYQVCVPGVSPGYVQLWSGKTRQRLYTWWGDGDEDQFGEAAALAGDCDGDGYGDLVVGAGQEGCSGVVGAGYARVFRGNDYFVNCTNPLKRVALGGQLALDHRSGQLGQPTVLFVLALDCAQPFPLQLTGLSVRGFFDSSQSWTFQTTLPSDPGLAGAALHFLATWNAPNGLRLSNTERVLVVP